MSQPNRKNKRLEALFSEKKPAPPNPAPSLLDNEPGAPKSENAESAALQGQPASTTSDAGMPGDQAAAASLVEQPESKDWLAPVARRGIFARITGVFDRLSYPRKFILVSLLFLLPTLVFLPLLNEQWQRIEEYGRQELRGVDYLQSLHHVLNELHVYQIEAARHDAGEIPLTKLQESASKVDGSFVELTLAHDRNGAPLQLTDEPTRLIAQWTAIKKGAMAGEDVGAPLAQLVTDLQKLIFNVGNTSNLILDPDLDTYYTMDAVLLKLPENQVLLSQILSLSNEAARNRQLTPEQRAQITVLAGRYQNNLDVLHTNLEVALQNNDSGQMRPMIQSSMGNYFASAAQFLSRLKVEIINTSIIDVESETILESGKQLMVAQQALIKDSSTALESGIQNRIDASTTRLIFQFGFAVITGLLAFLLGMSIMRAISVPLQSLTTAAERLTHGDMGARVTVLSGDEVGKAAAAFNAMVDRLQQTLTMLTDRTHDLTLAAEVSQHISEVRDVSALLTNATELIRQRFDLYYAQVYLLDNNSRNLVLRGGTGTVGQELLRRGFRLPVSMASINGTAVLEQRAIIISDTAQTVNFRPNPLLPKTRSEMCVPLLAGERVLGVLDLQSERPGDFSEENLPVFNTLVGQLTIALQNAALYTQAQESRLDLEAQISAISDKGWRDFLNAVERGQKLGYAFDQVQVSALNGESLQPIPVDTALSVPLQAAGADLGLIQVTNEPDHVWESRDVEVTHAVAVRLSQHIDNLRLLAQAEQYRDEAEQAVRRLTREGWDSYLQGERAPASGFEFDLNQVHPLNDSGNGHEPSGIVEPLTVRNEQIGEISAPIAEEEAKEIVSAIAAQLSEHIENLRLFEQTQTALFTTQQSQAKLSEALNIAKLGNWEYDFDNDLFTFNDQFYSIFHTTAEKVGGYKLSSARYAELFVHPDDAALVGQEIGRAIASTERHFSANLEHRTLYADGGIGYMTVEIHLERDEKGKIIRWYGANQDITERKLAELVIQESEAKLSEALNIARLANWEYDVEKDLFTFNDNFYSIFHTTVQEVGGYKLSAMDYAQRFVHPEDMPIVGKEIEKALSSTDRHYSTNLEHRVLFADGGMGYISVEIHIDRDEDGKIVRYYGANQDITERKKAELVIQESEAKLSEALQIAKLANWEYDVEKDLFTFNDNFYSIFHTTAKEVGGYQLSSMDYAQRFVHPEDMPIVGGEIEKALSSTDRHYSTRLEHRVLFADGGTGYISVEIHIDRDEDGKIIRYYGANQDITERKLAELAVQESEAKLSEALQIAKLANWDYDFDNDQFIFNDHFYSIFHTTAEKVGGYKLSSAQYAQLFVHPDDAALVGDEIGKAIASTKKHFTTKLEHRVIYADGGVGYISVDVHVDRDENGKIVRWYGANQDITERKKAEEVVRLAQERAQIILETVTIPMVITRISDNVLTFINQPATETANVKYEEAINRPAPDFYYNPDDRKKFIAELRERGRVFDMVVQLKRGDEPFWALLSARIFNYQNEPSILTTFMDITDRINAEEAVARRATELQTVAEVSTTTATTLQPEHLLQSVVDLTRERFGLYHAHIYLADDAWQTLLLAAGAGEVGRHMVADGWNIPIDHPSSIVADAARSRRSVIANDVYRDQESGFLSNKLLPETRSEMAVPMIAGDKVLGVFDVQSDVAGRFSQEDANIYTTLASQVAVALQNARLYMEQAATVTQLRELDRLKSAFLANMSHELRTPLNSILGFADVMLEELDGPLTEYMDNDLRLIQKNGQHLLHLINDVLDMAKIEAGRMNLNPEQFRVYEVLEEVTSITSPLASEKNLSLFIDEASDQDTEIYADRTRLRQVMINLVNNSIKFTETGKIAVKVKPIDGGRVLISVKDTGIGIPPDKLEAVFLEFTQVDTSTTRKVGGTGLGLPISRRLVEMHGGRLWAESTGVNGEGATFFVELPLEARITEVIEKQAK